MYFTGKVRLPRTEVLTSYAWTKANNLANDFGIEPERLANQNWEDDWGPTPNDVRHRFTFGGTSQVWRGLLLSSIIQANTGKPFNALAGLGGSRNAVRAINPATGQMFERMAFRAEGFFSWDMRVAYSFGIGNGRSIEALFEVFNITEPRELRRRSVRDDVHVAGLRNADGDHQQQPAAGAVWIEIQVLKTLPRPWVVARAPPSATCRRTHGLRTSGVKTFFRGGSNRAADVLGSSATAGIPTAASCRRPLLLEHAREVEPRVSLGDGCAASDRPEESPASSKCPDRACSAPSPISAGA